MLNLSPLIDPFYFLQVPVIQILIRSCVSHDNASFNLTSLIRISELAVYKIQTKLQNCFPAYNIVALLIPYIHILTDHWASKTAINV